MTFAETACPDKSGFFFVFFVFVLCFSVVFFFFFFKDYLPFSRMLVVYELP